MQEISQNTEHGLITLTITAAFRPTGWYTWVICREGRPYQRAERSFRTEQRAQHDGIAAMRRLLG